MTRGKRQRQSRVPVNRLSVIPIGRPPIRKQCVPFFRQILTQSPLHQLRKRRRERANEIGPMPLRQTNFHNAQIFKQQVICLIANLGTAKHLGRKAAIEVQAACRCFNHLPGCIACGAHLTCQLIRCFILIALHQRDNVASQQALAEIGCGHGNDTARGAAFVVLIQLP